MEGYLEGLFKGLGSSRLVYYAQFIGPTPILAFLPVPSLFHSSVGTNTKDA